MDSDAGFRRERLELVADVENWHFWFVARRELLLRMLGRTPPESGSRILDLGCGTGLMARELVERGHRVFALDLRPEGLRATRTSSSGILPIQADAQQPPLQDSSFDLVLALDVLEHLDDEMALERVARALRPGAHLLLSVPALPWLWSYRDDDAGHRRRYTRSSLRQLLGVSGLQAVDIRYFQFFLLPLLVVTRLLGRRGPGWRNREDRPHPLVNRLLGAVAALDVRLSDRMAWPLGSSLVALCRRGTGDE